MNQTQTFHLVFVRLLCIQCYIILGPEIIRQSTGKGRSLHAEGMKWQGGRCMKVLSFLT